MGVKGKTEWFGLAICLFYVGYTVIQYIDPDTEEELWIKIMGFYTKQEMCWLEDWKHYFNHPMLETEWAC